MFFQRLARGLETVAVPVVDAPLSGAADETGVAVAALEGPDERAGNLFLHKDIAPRAGAGLDVDHYQVASPFAGQSQLHIRVDDLQLRREAGVTVEHVARPVKLGGAVEVSRRRCLL